MHLLLLGVNSAAARDVNQDIQPVGRPIISCLTALARQDPLGNTFSFKLASQEKNLHLQLQLT